jgi:uncharacterized protein (TIGR03435 family)
MTFALVILAAALSARLGAQTPTRSPDLAPQFEVATVRVNTSGELQTRLNAPPGTGNISITNMMLRGVIQAAYELHPYQLVDIPSWVQSTRVDIIAKADRTASFTQLREMLKPLLAERFNLRVHAEQREMNVLALRQARGDGVPGPRLKRSAADCGVDADTPRDQIPARPADAPRCGIQPGGPGRILATGLDLRGLSALLGVAIGQPVVDQTDLKGGFDIDLQYTPERFASAALALRGAEAPPGLNPEGPSVYAALEEQLGLKLERARAPVDVIVIDHIEPLRPE